MTTLDDARKGWVTMTLPQGRRARVRVHEKNGRRTVLVKPIESKGEAPRGTDKA